MARSDPRNHSHIWADPDIGGLLMMRADFTTHSFAPHVHDELVIAVTEVGGSEFRSRGVRDHADPGTILVFNPGEPHSGSVDERKRWRYRAFYLAEAALAQFANDLELQPKAHPLFLMNKLQDKRLYERFLALHAIAERSGSVLDKQSELLIALARLFITHGDPAPKLLQVGSEKTAVSVLMQYLQDNHEASISLNDLAALTEMSAFHVIRSFNREVGLSPHAYLTQVRVRRARDLLEAGTSPAETAAMVGFYDQSALTRHFKRIYGVTPGQYAEAVGATAAAA